MNDYIDQVSENLKLQIQLNRLLMNRITNLETSYNDLEFRVAQLEKDIEGDI